MNVRFDEAVVSAGSKSKEGSIIKFVRKITNGRIADTKKISLVLLVFSVIALLVTVLMLRQAFIPEPTTPVEGSLIGNDFKGR